MFSDNEELILKILGRKKMTISEITKEFEVTQTPRLDRQNYVACAIRRINKKCDFFELDWTLVGDGQGRAGRTVWKEKR